MAGRRHAVEPGITYSKNAGRLKNKQVDGYNSMQFIQHIHRVNAEPLASYDFGSDITLSWYKRRIQNTSQRVKSSATKWLRVSTRIVEDSHRIGFRLKIEPVFIFREKETTVLNPRFKVGMGYIPTEGRKHIKTSFIFLLGIKKYLLFTMLLFFRCKLLLWAHNTFTNVSENDKSHRM